MHNSRSVNCNCRPWLVSFQASRNRRRIYTEVTTERRSDHNELRIQPETQDSEDSRILTSVTDGTVNTNQMTYTAFTRRRIAVAGALLFSILIPLSYVHAHLFEGKTLVYEKSDGSYVPGSEQLLQGSATIDPDAALGGGDVIVDGDALVPGGPFGADVVSGGNDVGEISVYTVREGDSLSQIAEMFDVTANTILWANDIDSATIQPGQELVILPIVGVRHVVKDGDTISTIAEKYDGDAEDILAYNQLASAASLSPGDTIIIPGGSMHTPQKRTTRTASAPAASSGGGGGYFSHPLPGSVRTQGIHGYNAVDLAAAAGTPIRAAASGEVIVARSGGWNGGYGTYLVLKHPNGTQTLYAHNSSNEVGVGAYVQAGQVVGYVGSTGRSTGYHLHFEVRGASNPF